MLFAISNHGDEHCNKPNNNETLSHHNLTDIIKGKSQLRDIRTNKGGDDDSVFEKPSEPSFDKENGDCRVKEDGGGDGNGEEYLEGEDGIDFSDEGPSELGVLSHRRVE